MSHPEKQETEMGSVSLMTGKNRGCGEDSTFPAIWSLIDLYSFIVTASNGPINSCVTSRVDKKSTLEVTKSFGPKGDECGALICSNAQGRDKSERVYSRYGGKSFSSNILLAIYKGMSPTFEEIQTCLIFCEGMRCGASGTKTVQNDKF